MKRILITTLSLGAILVAGCGPSKGAAQTAITAAQSAYDAARDQAMMIVPQQALSIQAMIAGAQASMEKGEFKAAIDSADAVPARVRIMMDDLPAKTTEMQAEWEKMKEFPQALVALNDQVVKLGKSKPLPQGIDKAKVEAAKAALGAITQNWTQAQAAYQGGALAEAMSKAHLAKQEAMELMESLGMALPEVMKE